MSYQFHFYRNRNREQIGSVIHRITLPDYPSRKFSAYMTPEGALRDAESIDAESGCGARSVKPESVQWLKLANRARAIWRFETENAGVDNDKRESNNGQA